MNDLGGLVITLDVDGNHRTTRTYRKRARIDDPNDETFFELPDDWIDPDKP